MTPFQKPPQPLERLLLHLQPSLPLPERFSASVVGSITAKSFSHSMNLAISPLNVSWGQANREKFWGMSDAGGHIWIDNLHPVSFSKW